MRIPLFDNDGTLLAVSGDNKVHNDALNEALKIVFDLSNASSKEILTRGKIDSQILIEIAMLHGISEEQAIKLLPKAFEVMTTYFEAHSHEGTPIAEKGVIDLLKHLKLHTHIGVLTGNIESIGWKKLELAGLKSFIDFGAFGNLALKRVELISVAKERYEKKFGQTHSITDFVIIGDTPLDIACAKDGGIKVIAVATGHFSKEELQKAGADLVLNSLEEKGKIMEFL